MLKNITFSAEEHLIELARRRAKAENTTLNAEFGRWLAQYAQRPRNRADFMTLMAHLQYAKLGKKFTRDELDER